MDHLAKIGSIFAAVGGVLLSEGSQYALAGKLLLAVGGIMITWGASRQAADFSQAMRAPVQVVAATPAAKKELADAGEPPVAETAIPKGSDPFQ